MIDLPDDLEFIASSIGREPATKLMQDCGGRKIYIPKRVSKTVIIKYIKQNFDGRNKKQICKDLDIGKSTFYKYLKG